MAKIKCVIVGDVAVGKTCMMVAYVKGEFPKEYIPTICDESEAKVELDGESFKLWIVDTAGNEGYDRLRPLHYTLAKVFLICFDVNNKKTLTSVQQKWVPELVHHAKGVPYLLIGTKTDLRDESQEDAVSFSSGEEMSKLVGAERYIECSATDQGSVQEVFTEAVIASQRSTKKPVTNWRCDLL